MIKHDVVYSFFDHERSLDLDLRQCYTIIYTSRVRVDLDMSYLAVYLLYCNESY
jgi:hypothetical protein